MSWRLLPVLIAAMQSLSSSSSVMEITSRRSFSILSGCGASEAKGWSPRATSVGRAGVMTGTTTDGTASPLRPSRFAVMAANLVELTGGSPEVLRQYCVWPVVRSASQHGGYRSPCALRRPRAFDPDPNRVPAAAATADRAYQPA